PDDIAERRSAGSGAEPGIEWKAALNWEVDAIAPAEREEVREREHEDAVDRPEDAVVEDEPDGQHRSAEPAGSAQDRSQGIDRPLVTRLPQRDARLGLLPSGAQLGGGTCVASRVEGGLLGHVGECLQDRAAGEQDARNVPQADDAVL